MSGHSPRPPVDTPPVERLLRLIAAMQGQPVVLLADLVADRFISGSPKRISREAPVLILSYEGESFVPGGGANAIANIAALGGEPLPLGIVGDDDNGDRLLEELESRGVTTEGIFRRGGFQTPTKTRILGGGRHSIKQQIVRYDIEETAEPSEEARRHFDQALEGWTGRAGIAVLSDYGYGAVEPELLARIRTALGPEGRVLCDSRHRLGDFHGLDGATPNEEEAEVLLGEPLADETGKMVRSGFALLHRLGARFLLITRGSHGMSLFEGDGLVEGGRAIRIPVHGTDQVADVTGAGDTVIGTFALALAAGANVLEAALLANFAGSVVVMKSGTATLTREELAEAARAGAGLLKEIRWERS